MAEYEPVDVEKEAYIQETLSAELDDAITRLAKKRKCQPPKCRHKARNIASSLVLYYSRVRVKTDSCIKSTAICSPLRNSVNPVKSYLHDSKDLNILAKDITDCLAEREDLMKAVQQYQDSQRKMDPSSTRHKHKFHRHASSHLYNVDFVVDEMCLS